MIAKERNRQMNGSIEQYWARAAKIVGTESTDAATDKTTGVELAAAFRRDGTLRMTPTAALRLTDAAIVAFYRALGEAPDLSATDPAWMEQCDFAFVNVRACSPRPDACGRVTDALKVIPTMRVSAIHLAPFFDHTLDNLYAVDSVRVVSDSVLDAALRAGGIDGDTQIRLLVDAIHRLGWRVGFDLEPHTATFSRIALGHPSCFRWLRVAPPDAMPDFGATPTPRGHEGLYGGVTQEEMSTPAAQAQLVEEVRALVTSTCAEFGLTEIEDLSQGVERVRACHARLTDRLMALGYWTLPSHTWNGVGLPRFDFYNREKNYPEYEYLDVEGKDQAEHAFGMLTPYRLFDALPVNAVPVTSPQPVAETIQFLDEIFPSVQERYGFDFVRLDYVDHVFDSTLPGSVSLPVSDRLPPERLAGILARARRTRPSTGAMAERMGVDLDDYASIGFNLLLGTDILSSMNAGYVDFLLRLEREIHSDDPAVPRPITGTAIPAGHAEAAHDGSPRHVHASHAPATDSRDGGANIRTRTCSVLAVVDTHDSGHPLFWTVPLADAVGPEGMSLRHFLARFLTCGARRRPKYECMGNQDLSTGLYLANNHPVSLRWRDDGVYNARYHALEDAYERFRPFLRTARLGPAHVDSEEGWAAWFLDGEHERLLCIAITEPRVERVKQWVAGPPVLPPVRRISIDIVVGRDWRTAQIEPVEVGGSRLSASREDNLLTLTDLPRPSAFLFRIY